MKADHIDLQWNRVKCDIHNIIHANGYVEQGYCDRTHVGPELPTENFLGNGGPTTHQYLAHQMCYEAQGSPATQVSCVLFADPDCAAGNTNNGNGAANHPTETNPDGTPKTRYCAW